LLTVYLGWRADVETPVPFDPDLPRHTAHTVDVARAMLHLTDWYMANGKHGVEIFNIADLGNKSTLSME
jgi:hypothetical protein